MKAPIVERFNGTLRLMIKKVMKNYRTLRYIDRLPDILFSYNNRVHSSIKPYTPAQVSPLNRDQVHNIQYDDYLREPLMTRKFAVGDTVRVATSIKKAAFRKSYKHATFTEDLFTVEEIKHRYNPPMYKLRRVSDGVLIEGPFYEDQMQRIDD